MVALRYDSTRIVLDPFGYGNSAASAVDQLLKLAAFSNHATEIEIKLKVKGGTKIKLKVIKLKKISQ